MKALCAMLVAAALGAGSFAGGIARAAEPAAAAASSGTMFKSIAYDRATQTLTVVMAKDGRAYRHLRVPEKLYKDFENAKSKGAFYLLYIRGKYEIAAAPAKP